jgi:hypothetical protein
MQFIPLQLYFLFFSIEFYTIIKKATMFTLKNNYMKKMISRIAVTMACITAVLLYSFMPSVQFEDIFAQLGITRTAAEKKIINSFLGGYFDQFGIMNAKNIVQAKRVVVTKEILDYTKQQTSGSSFIKEYNALRESERPQMVTVQTPEQFQSELINNSRKAVVEMEASAKKADASLKPTFEKMAADAKKQLKEVEDPGYKYVVNYRKNYPQLLKDTETRNAKSLSDWEAKYPADHMRFVKMRLEQFLNETDDIDFSAQLIEKNGVKYFANKDYERKSNRWKMAYRAGKEVIETARNFVQDWIKEIR